jgi:hypothetical protein
MKKTIVTICLLTATVVLGCADTSSDRQRNSGYSTGKQDTGRQSEEVDGRSQSRKSAGVAGSSGQR